jgi:hypothetical protein
MIGAARARLRTPVVGKRGCAVSIDRCLAPHRHLDRGPSRRRRDHLVIGLTDPASLRAAVDGVSRVLPVSGSKVAQRVQRHQNAIDAPAIYPSSIACPG